MKRPEKPPILSYNADELVEILTNNELIKKVFDVEKDYPYWETFKYKVKDASTDPVALWSFVKFQRKRLLSYLHISNVPEFHFSYSITPKIMKLLHEFDMNLGGILDGGSIIPSEEKNRYLISSIMEEAIASSQLEGAATTREVAKEMLRTQRKPRNNSEKMILNNYLTIKKIIELKDTTLSKELILEIHKIISSGTLKNSNYEGKFRDSNDVRVVDDITGEIFYNPPDYKHLDTLINDFCYFANCKEDPFFIHPIIRGIILHFLIGYIHPFVDGNGRTARALFYWFLISKGYWLIEYLSISRIMIKSPSQYARAYLYSEYDENDLTYFIDYNLKCMNLALKSLKEYINRKMSERQKLFQVIKNQDINERQAEILKEYINDPHKTISIKEIMGRFDVVYQTARLDLMRLVELGLLQDKKVGKKLIYFISQDFDKKINMNIMKENKS